MPFYLCFDPLHAQGRVKKIKQPTLNLQSSLLKIPSKGSRDYSSVLRATSYISELICT